MCDKDRRQIGYCDLPLCDSNKTYVEMVSQNASTKSLEETSSVASGTTSNTETSLTSNSGWITMRETSAMTTTETNISVAPRQNITLPTTNSKSVQATSSITSTRTTKNINPVTTTSKTDQTINPNPKSTEIEIQIDFSAKINITENGHNHGFSNNGHFNDDEDMLCGTLYQHDRFEGPFKTLNNREEMKSLGNRNNILSSLVIHNRKLFFQ